MPDIYYSKRSGIETDRILDKANGIKINDVQSSNILLNTIKIGDNIFKPNIPQKKYIYIHIVDLYIDLGIYVGKEKTLITIDDRETPYVEGTEQLFFKSFGGGVLLPFMKFQANTFADGCFFCNRYDNEYSNGLIYTYYELYTNKYVTNTSGNARINSDTIYRLEVEEL